MTALIKDQLQELYKSDEYLWLKEIIKLLKIKEFENIDLDNLIEELESLGRSEFNKVRSLLRQIITRLLLLEYWEQEYERNYRHWRGEIIAFRDDLSNELTTSLKNKIIQELDHIYNIAVSLVSQKTDLSQNTFPTSCPYSFEELLDNNWYPKK